MKRRFAVVVLVAAVLGGADMKAALAFQGDDPDWPCIQRKVPELSIGQIWTSGELPAAAADWRNDRDVAELVAELSARRVPLAEAGQKIKDFAKDLSFEERQARMTALARGLFDHMNQERSHVMSGIARYAGRQRDMADQLRQEASAVDDLRIKPGVDANELARRNDRLVFQSRIFQERVQSLTFVCEVPTLIEQRLYALARTVAETLKAK